MLEPVAPQAEPDALVITKENIELHSSP